MFWRGIAFLMFLFDSSSSRPAIMIGFLSSSLDMQSHNNLDYGSFLPTSPLTTITPIAFPCQKGKKQKLEKSTPMNAFWQLHDRPSSHWTSSIDQHGRRGENTQKPVLSSYTYAQKMFWVIVSVIIIHTCTHADGGQPKSKAHRPPTQTEKRGNGHSHNHRVGFLLSMFWVASIKFIVRMGIVVSSVVILLLFFSFLSSLCGRLVVAYSIMHAT